MFRQLTHFRYFLNFFLKSCTFHLILSQVLNNFYLYLLIQNKMAQSVYEAYVIDKNKDYQVKLAPSLDLIYKGDNSYRKAHALPYRLNEPKEHFIDDKFKVQIKPQNVNENKKQFALRRIYQIYDKDVDFLSQKLMTNIPLKTRKYYPTFLSQFSMIDKTYLKTLFFNKKITEVGFYKYFVRRNGQYHVEVIDDIIPVDPQTRLPPWGLNQFEPWKIILMKAWLKEKKTIHAMITAEPYEFIEAFGQPGYRALSISKELNHLAVSNISSENKLKKEQKIPLDRPGYIVVGKTRNSKEIQELGLVPNRAGYRIIKISSHQNKSIIQSEIRGAKSNNGKGEDNIYKIQSSLPSFWVGEYSVCANGKIHDPQLNKLPGEIKNIQTEFFASYFEISHIFSKFYIVPEYTSNKLSGNLIEDSYCVPFKSAQDFYTFQLHVQTNGFMNINIELPYDTADVKQDKGKSSRRYSYIKYFLAKKEANYNPNDLTGYSYYDGQYVKGYHKSCNRFLEIEPGTYYLYFKIQPNEHLKAGKRIAININSNAKLQSFKPLDSKQNSEANFAYIMQSALHNYNKFQGVKTFIGKDGQINKFLTIHISNCFDEIGFGAISITTSSKTTNFLAMDINLAQLNSKRLGVNKEAHLNIKKNEEVISVVAKPGESKIIIFQRTVRSKQTFEKFPPIDSVDFYQVI